MRASITDIQNALTDAAGDRWRVDGTGCDAVRLTDVQSGVEFGLTFTEDKSLHTVVAGDAPSWTEGMLLIPLLNVVRAKAQAAVSERASIGFVGRTATVPH